MKVFFIGAGASRGTLQSSGTPVPVAAQFGKVLNDIDRCWASKYPSLVKVVDHLGLPLADWGLEPVWTCVDYYAKLSKAILGADDWPGVSRELKKALLQVYGKRCDLAAEKLTVNDSYTLGHVLKNELKPGDALVSFNYDTIVERLARRFGHTMRPVCTHKKRGGIMLAKPHGSTSWIMELCSRRVISASDDGGPLLDSLTPKDVDQKREPLLLGAVPIKSELIREVQAFTGISNGRSWFEVFDTITQQWSAVVKAILDAHTIVVVGYSFPREDQYGRFLIQEATRLRQKRLIIEFFELKDKASDRAKEIIDAFDGRVAKLIFRGEVLPP